MPWHLQCFGYSALIDVKCNFEQTNPFECFFSLLYFNLTENRSKTSLAPHFVSESLHREVVFKHDL